MIVKSVYILLFILMVFLFYHLMNNCGCYNGVNNRVFNGFSVGGQSDACIIKNLDCLKTKQCKDMDLSNCDLSGKNLSGVGFDFDFANLSKANLSDADLSDSSFMNTNLIYANLSDANFSRGKEVQFYLANLNGANLSGANLTNSRISETSLISANLIDANLSDAKLLASDLTSANLSGATIHDVGCTSEVIGLNSAKIDPFPNGTPASYQCSKQNLLEKCAKNVNKYGHPVCGS